MDIAELADRINKEAVSGTYKIGSIHEFRKANLGKKQLPAKIFTYHTTSDTYAFHHGGRDEIQFNIGEELVEGKKVVRFGLCFSLEPSRSLTDPSSHLESFKNSFNDCFDKHPDWFKPFKIWYYRSNTRSRNFEPKPIEADWFTNGTFICLGRLIDKSLSDLQENHVVEIVRGFDELFPIYEYSVLHRQHKGLELFTRLTSNDNNWELPSGHLWKKKDQGSKHIAFENQYGFGHEEWLLDPRMRIGEFQYGFIRGLLEVDSSQPLQRVYLYTVVKDRTRNLVYYVGTISNVSLIKNDLAEQRKIGPVITQLRQERIREILEVHGDPSGLTKYPFQAVIKFHIDSASFFDEPVSQPNFDLFKYKRFKPYKLDGSIDSVFDAPQETDGPVILVPGKADQTSVYSRKGKASSKTIIKLHTEIVTALEVFLGPIYSAANHNISIELTRFSGNIADVVTWDDDTRICIYEVKTGASARRNIREAIAQLLDYALHAAQLTVEKLVIVSPVAPRNSDLSFIRELKSSISIPLTYLEYIPKGDIHFKEHV